MKLSDCILQYPFGIDARRLGLCRLRLFVREQAAYALLTDLGEKNPGQSITNAIERVVAAARKQGLVPGETSFIEHYPREFLGSDTFNIVSFSANGSPSWQSISGSQAAALLGCSLDELLLSALRDDRLLGEIDRLRNSLDPFSDSPWPESSDVIRRRLEIEAGMISKSSIATLVESGSKERDLQGLLKSDLSVFGELYGSPHDQYIAFSEFPVADGAVDFAVLTGTSRMDVVLIEVKGADFFLVNGDSYGAFARNVNQAADQIRNRLGYIYRNLAEFRYEAHKIRKSAEAGRKIHNAFLGPDHKLGVDPKKDICIRAVVIGGRTRDDFSESRKRHDYESTFSPPIKIESWDTLLRKLRRQ